MKKVFVFSDVHSFYDELMKALDDAGFDITNKDHVIISCGDMCDRGNKPREVLEFINSLPEERKVCIIGNHEWMLDELVDRGYAEWHDKHNRTDETIRILTGCYAPFSKAVSRMRNNTYWKEYKKSWRFYFELEDKIFVHGWLPIRDKIFGEPEIDPDWREASQSEMKEATWINGMEAWSNGLRLEGKTIFCGHIHTSWGHARLHNNGVEYPDESKGLYGCFDAFIDEGIVALDACTAYSGKVNVYCFETEDEIWNKSIS